jgi:hypothetical protein
VASVLDSGTSTSYTEMSFVTTKRDVSETPFHLFWKPVMSKATGLSVLEYPVLWRDVMRYLTADLYLNLQFAELSFRGK